MPITGHARRLSVAVLAAGLAASVHAEPHGLFAPPLRLSEVRSAQRLPDKRLEESRVPAHVTVVTEEDIRLSGAKSLQELLAAQMGVVTYDDVGNQFQQTVDLRGFNATPGPAAAVYVDGVRINESNLGQVNYHLVPLEQVERIEIHRGPSTLYGRNALAGVIHISTKRGAAAFAAEAGAGYGSFERRKGWLSVGDRLGDLDYQVVASREDDGGHRRHSDVGVGATLLKLGYRLSEGSDVAVSYARADDRVQQPGSLTGAELAADPRQNRSEADHISRLDFFTYNQRQALAADFSLAVNGFYRKRREDTPLNRGRSSISRSLAELKSSGLTGQLSRDWEVLGRRNIATFGVEALRGEADTSSLYSFGGAPTFSGAFTRDEALGLFGQTVYDLSPDALTLTLGLRYDQATVRYDDRDTPANGGSQGFNRTNPRVGLNWNPSEAAGLYASYAEAFRSPTVNEISALGPFGSGALKPVKARNYELGGRFAPTGWSQLRAAAFWDDVSDEIYPVFDTTLGYGRNINVDKTRRTGVEWGGTAAWRDRVEWRWSHTFTRSTFQSDMQLDKPPYVAAQRVAKGDSIPMVPPHRVARGLQVRP
ncbi:MAG: TonB-dependent receptor, partial [Elusimicrobia bacterium]|nr:TonB-dependent receptor [Elusimicrobiota bacterium]